MDVERFSIPILVHYEDRMSMAWAREIRVPFLDYRLIETLVSLPMEAKLNHGWTKYVLRRALEPFLPPEIVWRKDKQGFVNPQAEWLKHELRPLVMDFFSQDSLIFTGQWVHRRNLLEKYDQYCRQPVNKGSLAFRDIFNPLAMEVWLRRFSGYLA